MILHIDESMTLGDIQDKFSRCFPNLKIEFYQKPHGFKETSSPEQVINPNVALARIRKKHSPGNLTILSSDKVGKVESMFKKLFDLNIQVFRKEHNSWIQTSFTDKYSLKELSNLSIHYTS